MDLLWRLYLSRDRIAPNGHPVFARAVRASQRYPARICMSASCRRRPERRPHVVVTAAVFSRLFLSGLNLFAGQRVEDYIEHAQLGSLQSRVEIPIGRSSFEVGSNLFALRRKPAAETHQQPHGIFLSQIPRRHVPTVDEFLLLVCRSEIGPHLV